MWKNWNLWYGTGKIQLKMWKPQLHVSFSRYFSLFIIYMYHQVIEQVCIILPLFYTVNPFHHNSLHIKCKMNHFYLNIHPDTPRTREFFPQFWIRFQSQKIWKKRKKEWSIKYTYVCICFTLYSIKLFVKITRHHTPLK